jgi:hypothetical protein
VKKEKKKKKKKKKIPHTPGDQAVHTSQAKMAEVEDTAAPVNSRARMGWRPTWIASSTISRTAKGDNPLAAMSGLGLARKQKAIENRYTIIS